MSNDEVMRLLNLIGSILSKDTEYAFDITLLHARVAENAVGWSVFKDLGSHILYRWPSQELTDPLLDLWEEEPSGRRWDEIEYLVRDGKFEARFIYPDEIDPDEDFGDRRTRIVKQVLGDKPIVYPPFEEDDAQLFEL